MAIKLKSAGILLPSAAVAHDSVGNKHSSDDCCSAQRAKRRNHAKHTKIFGHCRMFVCGTRKGHIRLFLYIPAVRSGVAAAVFSVLLATLRPTTQNGGARAADPVPAFNLLCHLSNA